MIEVRDLVKHFGPVRAVGVTFTAREGEVLALLGPNGAGKTTTLRLLSTVLRPSAGTATVAGHDTRREPTSVRAALGVLPENWGLYGRLTPREHLRYFGHLHELSGEDLECRVEAVVRMLEMEGFADRRCEPFSKGMKQKAALGRAVMHSPRHLLLDEPTAGLDVMSARSVRELIGRFRDEGRCVILSTHILSEAERLCDRLAIIHRGKIVAVGGRQVLLEQTGRGSLEEAFVGLVGEAAEEMAT